jgi:hypothetical protein
MGADSQKLTKPVTEKPATSRLFNAFQTLSGFSRSRSSPASLSASAAKKM